MKMAGERAKGMDRPSWTPASSDTFELLADDPLFAERRLPSDVIFFFFFSFGSLSPRAQQSTQL